MNLEKKLKKYQIDIGNLGVMPYQEGDRVLIRVNTKNLSKSDASAKLLEVQMEMQKEFPGAKVIAHPEDVAFFVLPKSYTDEEVGGRIISVETI